MAVLVARHLLYDCANPTSPANDHLLYPADATATAKSVG